MCSGISCCRETPPRLMPHPPSLASQSFYQTASLVKRVWPMRPLYLLRLQCTASITNAKKPSSISRIFLALPREPKEIVWLGSHHGLSYVLPRSLHLIKSLHFLKDHSFYSYKIFTCYRVFMCFINCYKINRIIACYRVINMQS